MSRTFRFVGGTSDKYWIISDETPDPNSLTWTVITTYGRQGSSGHTKPKGFRTREEAYRYRGEKIREKLSKGYTEVFVGDPRTGPPTSLPSSRTIPAVLDTRGRCSHDALKKTSANAWKCAACGHTIEFDKPAPNQPEITLTVAKRYIDIAELE